MTAYDHERPQGVRTRRCDALPACGGLAGAGWIRDNVDPAVGVAATIALSVVFATGWLWVSMRLPSRDVRWTAFLPGAILLGVGLNALHIFTVYYLSEKLAHSAQLYGGHGPGSDGALLPLPDRPRRDLGRRAERDRLGGPPPGFDTGDDEPAPATGPAAADSFTRVIR